MKKAVISCRNTPLSTPVPNVKDGGLIKGAFILSVGGFVAKILGALYRIPLISVIGTEGIGVYQTAFPIYCILLTFSSTGVPSAVAKLISGGYDGVGVLKTSLKIFLPLGILGSLLMIGLSGIISSLQGNPQAKLAYLLLAPSVAAVSIISCIRGYFQGKRNMAPTAVSQITEQAIKLIVGLALCYTVKASPQIKGGLACLAVSISEGIALLYLYIRYKKERNVTQGSKNISIKRLIATLFPIVLASVLLPLSRTLDSFTIVNFLSRYTQNATTYYGIYTGSVESVSGVPVAICYGVATASLPAISSAFSKKDFASVKKNLLKSLSLTLLLSTFMGLGLFTFSDLITKILFGSLSFAEKRLTAKLLSLSFFSVIGLSLVQTLNSCLIAIGKPFVPSLFLGVGILIKFILQFLLLKNPAVNLFGALYSDISCYFVAVFLDLLYIIYNTSKRKMTNDNYSRGNRI